MRDHQNITLVGMRSNVINAAKARAEIPNPGASTTANELGHESLVSTASPLRWKGDGGWSIRCSVTTSLSCTTRLPDAPLGRERMKPATNPSRRRQSLVKRHGKHRDDRRPRHLNESPQARIRCVPACDQDDSWRRAARLQPTDKIGVLRHHNDVGGARSGEDLRAGGALKAQVTNRQAFDRERGTHPHGERRRKLIANPERHAATMG
jgi:hypothetical protein